MSASHATPTPRALVSFNEVRRRLGGVARSTVRRWWLEGVLPKPRKIGTTMQAKLVWDAAELDRAIAKIGRPVGSELKSRRA